MAASEDCDTSIVDLDQWVMEWPRVKKYLKKKNHRVEVDWSNVQLIWEDTIYGDDQKTMPLKTSSQLYRSTAVNKYDEPYVHRFKGVKKAHSCCEVNLFSAIKRNGAVEATLGSPPSAVKAGVSSHVSFQDTTCAKFNKEIEYHIDTEVTIKKDKGVTLTVSSIEQEFAATFDVKVKVRGTVGVLVYKNDVFVARTSGNFREIYDTLPKNGPLKSTDNVSGVGEKDITFSIDGHCRFQYVVDHRSELSEAKPQEDLAEMIPPLSVDQIDLPSVPRQPRGLRQPRYSYDEDEMSELAAWAN